MADEPDVTVVNVETGADDTPPVVVTTDTSDPWPTIAAHGERLVVCEGGIAGLAARLDEMDGRISGAQFTAELASEDAGHAISVAVDALDETRELAEEAEEAVAAVAEEADADTAEVQQEVEEIAPNRDHPWFKRRKLMAGADR